MRIVIWVKINGVEYCGCGESVAEAAFNTQELLNKNRIELHKLKNTLDQNRLIVVPHSVFSEINDALVQIDARIKELEVLK